jgi:hypothetical protein
MNEPTWEVRQIDGPILQIPAYMVVEKESQRELFGFQGLPKETAAEYHARLYSAAALGAADRLIRMLEIKQEQIAVAMARNGRSERECYETLRGLRSSELERYHSSAMGYFLDHVDEAIAEATNRLAGESVAWAFANAPTPRTVHARDGLGEFVKKTVARYKAEVVARLGVRKGRRSRSQHPEGAVTTDSFREGVRICRAKGYRITYERVAEYCECHENTLRDWVNAEIPIRGRLESIVRKLGI